jgi:hypothetical protein
MHNLYHRLGQDVKVKKSPFEGSEYFSVQSGIVTVRDQEFSGLLFNGIGE